MKYDPNCLIQQKQTENHYTPTHKVYVYGYLHVSFEINTPFLNFVELYNLPLSFYFVESPGITNDELPPLSVLNLFITESWTCSCNQIRKREREKEKERGRERKERAEESAHISSSSFSFFLFGGDEIINFTEKKKNNFMLM